MCCKRVRPLLGRPTSLIRGVRGRVRCDIQIDEAKLHNRALLSSVPNVTTRTSRAAQCNPLEPDHEVDPRARTWLHARVTDDAAVPRASTQIETWPPAGWSDWSDERRRIWRLEQQCLRWEQMFLEAQSLVDEQAREIEELRSRLGSPDA